MVHACIIARANMYEEPRPPRRGSHRPAPSSRSYAYPALNDWRETRDPLVYDGSASPPRFDVSGSPPMRGSLFPEQDASWDQASLLPARRAVPSSNLSGRQRGSSTGRSSAEDSYYSPRYQTPTEPSPSFSADTMRTAASKAPSSLELIRQLHGRIPDRLTLEQSILESYARSAPQSASCQSAQKRCMYPGCSKISVSRGLCRGHGGGRRCHVPDCTKSAQSRSNFCWAHGGGQRCDVDQCMRSRKSKHFCVAHMHLEGASDSGDSGSGSGRSRSASPPDQATSDHRTTVRRAASAGLGTQPAVNKTSGSRAGSPPVRALPSLGQALSSASRSAPNLPARSVKPFLSV